MKSQLIRLGGEPTSNFINLMNKLVWFAKSCLWKCERKKLNHSWVKRENNLKILKRVPSSWSKLHAIHYFPPSSGVNLRSPCNALVTKTLFSFRFDSFDPHPTDGTTWPLSNGFFSPSYAYGTTRRAHCEISTWFWPRNTVLRGSPRVLRKQSYRGSVNASERNRIEILFLV